MMKLTSAVALGALACGLSTSGHAAEGTIPTGVPKLDHVFVIMMENHGSAEILNNPNTPFINQFVQSSNFAANYFGVAHPSLTNYLEVTGGSNFGVLADPSPDWHNTNCVTNLAAHTVDNEAVSTPVCPISGFGTEAPTPAIDYSNETSGPPGDYAIDGVQSIPTSTTVVGKNISFQLESKNLTWKSYQQSLPVSGADLIDNADGLYSNLTNFQAITPAQTPALTSSDLVALYAVKHNPFVYFAAGQTKFALEKTVSFETLYGDLAAGTVPNYSFIVPNQCNDQHGRGNAGAFCNYDPDDNGTQAGMNPALLQQGDVTVERLVTAIHDSPVWKTGNNAIVLIWDENDYYPGIPNQVVAAVNTNYSKHRVVSTTRYTHFSLLKSVEAGFGLPCLNHACDATVPVMSDVFGAN